MHGSTLEAIHAASSLPLRASTGKSKAVGHSRGAGSCILERPCAARRVLRVFPWMISSPFSATHKIQILCYEAFPHSVRHVVKCACLFRGSLALHVCTLACFSCALLFSAFALHIFDFAFPPVCSAIPSADGVVGFKTTEDGSLGPLESGCPRSGA